MAEAGDPIGPGRALLVDDDLVLLRSLARELSRCGLEVVTCSSASQALEHVSASNYDVVVSDIAMPELDGIALLRAVRARDPDLPVVLMTGMPAVESAAMAVEYGALKYLVKPCVPQELEQVLRRAVGLYRLARAKRHALSVLGTSTGEGSDRAGLEASFERALAGLWMAFQPLVRAQDGSLFGYEALLRSSEPLLSQPGMILDAAERLGQLQRLGARVRELAAEPMLTADPEWKLFVNLHPVDLLDPVLAQRDASLSRISERVVLEVTERAPLDRVPEIRRRTAQLRELGFRIAIDDLGAGYAGLSSFVHLEPEFVKLDMSLVRDIDRQTVKRRLVRGIIELAQDMGLSVIAEGVETAPERDTLADLGCEVLQGFLFGMPSRPFVAPAW